jgi:threonine/homoserine/homoserine lactone efflux protein
MVTSATVGLALLGLGAAISVLNWFGVYRSWRTGRSHFLIPLVGGICLLIGTLLVARLRPFAWVALLADAGTIVVFLGVPFVFWEAWRTWVQRRQAHAGRHATAPQHDMPRTDLFRMFSLELLALLVQ